MEVVKETRRLINHKDVLVAATWRYMLKAIWLFFPPIIFIFLSLFVCWHLTQGRDLMVIVLEDKSCIFSPALFFLILALVFWVIVTWYTTRIVAKAKEFQQADHHHIWQIFLVQSPRVLAFSCITILLCGFIQVKLYISYNIELEGWFWYLMLLVGYGYYYLLYILSDKYLTRPGMTKTARLAFMRKAKLTVYGIIFFWILITTYLATCWSIIIFLFGLQAGLVLLLLLRREIDETARDKSVVSTKDPADFTPRSGNFKTLRAIFRKMRYIVTFKEDRQYYNFFRILSGIALTVYILALTWLRFSIWVGSLPFLLLAFGVLLGIGNFITTFSVFARFNFHLLFIIWSLALGKFVDPHFTTLVDKDVKTVASFDKRQNLREYFMNWVTKDPERKRILDDTSVKKYPVYFVIANGGASRSGYWVASVLSKLQDTSHNNFANHLFCLSGASGGSVGNATFFSLLRQQKELMQEDKTGKPFWSAATRYLESDFLTYTLSRLLGRDILRHIIPAFKKYTHDRADALARSLEEAPGQHNFLYKSFAAPFSSFITQTGDTTYKLPILCINTTRMQDGSPAVISNIDINDKKNYFNKRIDVLSLLVNQGKDIKLSTSVVLGASFPYLSPAGRIDNKPCDSCPKESHYFVDGGYFDNSGAGVVNEMLIAIAGMKGLLKTEPALAAYANKLDFYVLHITNNDKKKSKLHRINPFTNDIMSPVQTIMGSYGTQTIVNDQRLINYLGSLYTDEAPHYINIDLYADSSYMKKFSMNWVISDYQRSRMDSNLIYNKKFRLECDKMKAWKY